MKRAAAHSSRRVVYVALGSNLLIAIAKFASALVSGSAAMLSEGVHSLIDTGNQALLLHGLRRARRGPDASHPFGYGLELYFWAFVVAVFIFGLGAVVSIYEGIHKLAAPRPVEHAYVNYIVLAIAMALEGTSWSVALRQFRKANPTWGLIEAVRRSKDPSVFTVLLEDTAAIAGLAIAAIGIAGSQLLAMPLLDGIASIAIGLVLGATALFLAAECRSLLAGEGLPADITAELRRSAAAQPGVNAVNEVLTMHFGPADVLLALSLDFDDTLPAGRVEATVSRLESQIKRDHPQITRVFVEAQAAKPRTAAD